MKEGALVLGMAIMLPACSSEPTLEQRMEAAEAAQMCFVSTMISLATAEDEFVSADHQTSIERMIDVISDGPSFNSREEQLAILDLEIRGEILTANTEEETAALAARHGKIAAQCAEQYR